MSLFRAVLLLFAITVALASWNSSTLTPLNRIIVSVDRYHQNYPQEKFFVHTDKPFYVIGETIWFKVYGVLATSHIPLTPSGLVYVDLLDKEGKILIRKHIRIEKGGGIGDILLDPQWKVSGLLTLRACSAYNLNFEPGFIFQKRLAVYDAYQNGVPIQERNDSTRKNNDDQRDINLGLYPEGGHLITGLESLVAVKGTDHSGKGIPIRAKVFDANNRLITLFITNQMGFGSFSLKPTFGSKYHVDVQHEGRSFSFDVPAALETGAILSIKHLKNDTLAIITQSNTKNLMHEAFIVGHTRGEVFYSVSLDSTKSKTLLIPTHDIQPGIAHFTFFVSVNNETVPMAERLVFVNSQHYNPDSNAITIDPSSNAPSELRYINLNLEGHLTDSNHIYGSVSICPKLPVDQAFTEVDIQTYLYFLSDLPGAVENPGYYFDLGRVIHPKELDLLMLTHGWRRFKWEEVLSEKALELKYLPENGFTIRGRTTNGISKKGVSSNVFLSILHEDLAMMNASSNSEGYFELAGLQIDDTTNMVLNAYKISRKEKLNLKNANRQALQIEISDYPSPINATSYLPVVSLQPTALTSFLNTVRNSPSIAKAYEDIWSVDFQAVEVRATKLHPVVEAHRSEMLYKEPDSRIILDSMPALAAMGATSSVYDIIRRLPGVEIHRVNDGKIAIIRGIATIKGDPRAMVLLNGVKISDATLNDFPVDNIAFIDVLRNTSKANIYGSNTGVIAIYTKTAEGIKGNHKPMDYAINMKHPGYYRAREFFNAEISAPEVDVDQPPYQSTLLWEPDLVFSKDSPAIKIPFYVTDRKSEYSVTLHGITSEGYPISEKVNFIVN